jgi:hypothetical protein
LKNWGAAFLLPRENPMQATTIAVIVLSALFVGGMAILVIIMNTAPKKKDEDPARKEPR